MVEGHPFTAGTAAEAAADLAKHYSQLAKTLKPYHGTATAKPNTGKTGNSGKKKTWYGKKQHKSNKPVK